VERNDTFVEPGADDDGPVSDALKEITKALSEEHQSVRLKWQARDVFSQQWPNHESRPDDRGNPARVSGDPSEFRDAPSLVVFGRAALAKNADPKRVLDQLFETARKADPKARDVYLASGELALDKHDFALASKKFGEGLKQLPDDAELNYGWPRLRARRPGADAGGCGSGLESEQQPHRLPAAAGRTPH